jgi:hypothetical protein
VGKRITRTDAIALVGRARQAFDSWERVRNEPMARVYLAALLLVKKWDR